MIPPVGNCAPIGCHCRFLSQPPCVFATVNAFYEGVDELAVVQSPPSPFWERAGRRFQIMPETGRDELKKQFFEGADAVVHPAERLRSASRSSPWNTTRLRLNEV